MSSADDALIRPSTSSFSSPSYSSSSPSSSSHLQRGASGTLISLRRTGRQEDRRKPGTMHGSPRHGTAVGVLVLLNALLFATEAAEGVLTEHLLVQLHEDAQDEAHQLAAQHGFQSARKVGCLVKSVMQTLKGRLNLSLGWNSQGELICECTGKGSQIKKKQSPFLFVLVSFFILLEGWNLLIFCNTS